MTQKSVSWLDLYMAMCVGATMIGCACFHEDEDEHDEEDDAADQDD
jgi:hypothetical protein